MDRALLWFRDDLRLDDHPALQELLRLGLAPVPVYVHDPEGEGAWAPGAASNAWRARSLLALDAALRARGSRLQVLHGPAQEVLPRVLAASGIRVLRWHRRYEPALQARDAALKQALRGAGIDAQSRNGALLAEPWDVRTQAGEPYRVFTPFWRALQAAWRWPALQPAPDALPPPPDLPDAQPVQALARALAPARGWDAGFWQAWTPGEAGAQAALARFLQAALADYAQARDVPDRPGTSRLSPHLHFGEIAPWRVAHAVRAAAAGGSEAYLRELGWREFGYHLLHHFPHTPEANFNPRFDAFPWAADAPALLRAWQRGRTGIPIVDAGMRELWHTGWMHNRVRMIAGSLLTKHLRQHWRHGARWFWDTLVDADLANNTLGWQWVAGTGADAAPYHRVFNPVLQAQRFDPDGAYIARWVPELAGLPPARRHAPWEGGAPPRGYPAPIVDLARGRAQALAALEAIRRG